MTRRRISNRTPRELTAKERSALSDVVLELDSDFRVKTGSVANISLETPEPGVIVLNEYDGLMYYADNYGWHQQGADWSPITLFVEFNGTDQFNFKFKAPADSADPSTLIIHDGDGTITEVDGNDDTVVTHTTDYSEAGTYYFYVLGDVLDLTALIVTQQSFVSGSVDGFGALINLTDLQIWSTSIYGDVANLKTLVNITYIRANASDVWGDIGELETLVLCTYFRFNLTDCHGDVSRLTSLVLLEDPYFGISNISGDISEIGELPNVNSVIASSSKVTFDKVANWSTSITISVGLQDCNFTSMMVDNALNSMVNLTGVQIYLAGNNAPRTTASDAAVATLIAAGNTLTVNE